MIPAPSFKHQKIVGNLFKLVSKHVEEQDLGEVVFAPLDVKFSKIDVLQPDVLFISKQRMKNIKQPYVEGAPDLVVEVLSPSTAERDKTVKKDIYYREGVREMWIVDPDEETVSVFEREERGFEKTHTILPGETMKSGLFDEFSPSAELFFPE